MSEQVKILSYSPAYKAGCLALFDSNQGKYFDASERSDFERFLVKDTGNCPYFVVVEEDKVIGCGGYAKMDDHAILCWGMVARALHKKGIGSWLLTHRLQEIEATYDRLPVHMHTSQHTQGFYRRFGFDVQSVKADGFGPGIDEVFMIYQPR